MRIILCIGGFIILCFIGCTAVLKHTHDSDVNRDATIAQRVTTLGFAEKVVTLQNPQVTGDRIAFSHEGADYELAFGSNETRIYAHLILVDFNDDTEGQRPDGLLRSGVYELEVPIGLWYNPFDGTYDEDEYRFSPANFSGTYMVIGTQ